MKLFEQFSQRDITFRNRIAVSPMCTYSAVDGIASDWHFVHLGSLATGGAGTVIAEATAVVQEGRITYADLGLWNDAQAEALAPITRFIREQGAVAGIQLGHAGRKASAPRPWDKPEAIDEPGRSWPIVGPTDQAYSQDRQKPEPLDVAGIRRIIKAFGDAAQRAVQAGFNLVEIHGAHGFLLHEFLSPLVNTRTDDYGGSFQNRVRFLLEVTDTVRSAIPTGIPLWVRLSTTDWRDDGWTVEDSIHLAGQLRDRGVDLIDCSAGGAVREEGALPPGPEVRGPGYQAHLAHAVRTGAGIPTGAVGKITSPEQAEHVLESSQADIVLLGREFLRDPRWPLRAASTLGQSVPWPKPYERARP